MKEPLKNKKCYATGIAGAIQFEISTSNYDEIKDSLNEVYYSEKDIKSAIAWFKKEIRSLPPELSRKQFDIQLAYIIPIAFNDVCADCLNHKIIKEKI